MESVSKFFLGSIVGMVTMYSFSSSKPSRELESCVNAYYADKYNGNKYGDPRDTFMKCMHTQNKELFEETKKKYTQKAPTPQNEDS